MSILVELMRAFHFIALLLLIESSLLAADVISTAQTSPLQANSNTNHTPQSYVSDYRLQPIWYSLEEITTRTWKAKDGQTIRLLSREVVKVGLPDLGEVLVARYGGADSNRTVCVDFYAKEERLVQENYLLLCHDVHCPELKTKVAFEEEGGRRFFTVSGESPDAGTLKRWHHQYSYELNNQWQMVEGLSNFNWEVH